MPTLSPTTVAYDGFAANPDYVFSEDTNADKPSTYDNPQLIKFQSINLWHNYVSTTLKANRDAGSSALIGKSIYVYENDNWVVKSGSIMLPEGIGSIRLRFFIKISGSPLQIYISKNEAEDKLVPNLSTTDYLVKTVESHLDPNTISQYTRVANNDYWIFPLCDYCLTYTGDGTETSMQVICLTKLLGSSDPYRLEAKQYSGATELTVGSAGNGIVMSTSIQRAGEDLPTLAERVAILEQDVASLKATVAKQEKVLADLPSIIAATYQEIGTLYVSR